jgi:hypothetical protein
LACFALVSRLGVNSTQVSSFIAYPAELLDQARFPHVASIPINAQAYLPHRVTNHDVMR